MRNGVEIRQAIRAASAIAVLTVLTGACAGEDDGRPPPPDGGASNVGGAGGAAPDAATGPEDLGKACSLDAGPGGCSAGLSCVRADSIGGSVCTRSCGMNADCPSNGFCHATGETGGGVCARECTHQVVCVALGTSTSCAAHSSSSSTKICAR